MRTLGVLVPLALVACSDADVAPMGAVTAAAPDTLFLGDDTRNDLTITIEYTDRDGDLGRGIARIHDCRDDALVTALMLPSIASEEAVTAGVAITGVLDLRVNDVGRTGPTVTPSLVCSDLGIGASVAGVAVFCVVLVDAAGHQSVGDCTLPVSLR